MNERAKQLALQSGLETQLWPNDTDPAEETAVQKFAELIVRECLTVIGKERRARLDKANLVESDAIQKSAVAIIKHFGLNP